MLVACVVVLTISVIQLLNGKLASEAHLCAILAILQLTGVIMIPSWWMLFLPTAVGLVFIS